MKKGVKKVSEDETVHHGKPPEVVACCSVTK